MTHPRRGRRFPEDAMYTLSTVTLLLALAAGSIRAGPADEIGRVRALVEAGRFGEALELIETSAAAPGQREALELRARCEFELGSWAACERSLQALAGQVEIGSADWIAHMTRLARVQLLQGLHGEAVSTVENVLEHDRSPDLLRTAVRACLRARQYERAQPYVNELLERDPTDIVARYYRGLVLSKTGRMEEALDDLRRGIGEPSLAREARFELALTLGQLGRPRQALEELCAVIERDPYHAEACYQASRQLIELGSRPALAVAGKLVRYFQGLRELEGPGSRDHHLEARGDLVGAALLRAARWERLGALDRALEELIRARAIRPGSVRLAIGLGQLWSRQGLLTEAARELARARQLLGEAPSSRELAEQLRSLDAALADAREALAVDVAPPVLRARQALARAGWETAEPSLLALLDAARAAGRRDVSLGAARLLLARNPDSTPALRELVGRTADPSLLVPHLHYLRRLTDLMPGDGRAAEARQRAREMFLGKRAP